jgi:hypothetical protein
LSSSSVVFPLVVWFVTFRHATWMMKLHQCQWKMLLTKLFPSILKQIDLSDSSLTGEQILKHFLDDWSGLFSHDDLNIGFTGSICKMKIHLSSVLVTSCIHVHRR